MRDKFSNYSKMKNEEQKTGKPQGNGVLPCVSGSASEWRKPLIDRVKYELRKYTELAKRMDELLNECNLEAKYDEAREAEIKRNCYYRFVNDLKQLVS